MKNLNQTMKNHGGWWIVVILAIMATFYVLGGIINQWPEGFSHEVAAAFVGAVLTVAVTAFLLRQQTESAAALQEQASKSAAELQNQQFNTARKHEEEQSNRAAAFQKELLTAQAATDEGKEKSVKIYEAKLKAYEDLMNTIEEIVRDKDAKADSAIRMQFQAYRTKFIAGEVVEQKLTTFAKSYCEAISDDNIFDDNDWQKIKIPMGHLVNAMKADLDGKPYIEAEQVLLEAPDFTPKRVDKDIFLSQCYDNEKDYLAQVIQHCQANAANVTIEWGGKGFSIRDGRDPKKRPVLWVFPQKGANSNSNIQARTEKWTLARGRGLRANSAN